MTRKRRWVYTLIRTKPKTKPCIRQSNHDQRDAPPTIDLKHKTQTEASPLHAVPEVVCVEEAIKLRVQVDNIDASLCSIPNNGTGKVASVVVLFGIDAQAAVNTKSQPGSCFVSLSASREESSTALTRPHLRPCSQHSRAHRLDHPTFAIVS